MAEEKVFILTPIEEKPSTTDTSFNLIPLETKETKKIFLENENRVMSFEANKTFDEINSEIELNVYGKSKFAFLEIGKATVRGVESSLSGVGAMVEWIGDSVQQGKTLETLIGANPSTVGMKPLIKFTDKRSAAFQKEVGRGITEWGDTAVKFWQKQQLTGFETADPELFRGSFLENPSWLRATALIAGAIPSLATAAAVTFATKNPIVGAASLGLIEGSQVRREAKEAGVEFEKGTVIGIASVVGTTLLEIIPMTGFLRKSAGKGVIRVGKDVVTGMVQEGSEEVAQAFWNNLLAKIGYDSTRNLTEGMVEGFIAGAGSGGVIGGFSSRGGLNIDEGVREALNKGATQKDVEIARELIKEQIIDNAPEIDKVLNESAKEIAKAPDKIIAKPTPKVEEEVARLIKEEGITEEEARKRLAPKPKPFIERIQEIKEKFKRPETIAKKEVKIVQEEIIKELEASELEAEDKAKFIKTIKNIQTAEQLQKALPEIDIRINRLVEAEGKRTTKESIKKELKTTKPLKVGQKRVGKFDFETNKVFDTLRSHNKLNQSKAQVEFDKLPEEGGSELDLIKKRFLSLKANGASASLEIHEQVLVDIQRIKRLGKQAKDEADLEKRLNRQEIVEDALSSIDKIKADKDTVKTKIGNVYRRGFSNIYSMLNSIGGKAFAEAHDLELSENKRNTATYRDTLKITNDASKIYNEKNIMRLFETMSLFDYQITDTKDGLTTKLSKLELIDIYNSIKNDKKKADYFETFGQDQVETLLTNLTNEDKLFGDALQENIQGFRPILNKRNIETTGRDLGFVENYWPGTSEFQVDIFDDIRLQGETPSAAKERARGRVIPIPRNAWYKAQRAISQAEHVSNVSRDFEKLKRLFTDRKVKHAIEQKFGEDVYGTLIDQVDNLSLNKQTDKIDAISGTFQKAINNWVTAKIAFNPSTFVRQLMSVGNYAENMNAAEWTTGFFKGIASPKETFKFVWKNAPFLEARFNKGFSEALKEAIKGAESISVNKKNWTKMLTSLVRAGDVTAIVYGGFPLIKSELAKGKSMQEAIDVFEKATLKSQQSGLSASTSQFQNSTNPFTRLFLAFKNTSNQYFRKMADSIISFQNGDITVAQFAKTMTIYAVIQPILYVSAGFGTKIAFSFLGRLFGLRGDEEDFDEIMEKFFNDIMIQMIVGPVNAIPIINDAVRAAARKATGQKVYQFLSIPWLDDLEKAGRAMLKENVAGNDYLKMMSAILEPATSLPIATPIRYFEILTGKKIAGKKKQVKF